jgi:hypothetical protein
MQQEEKEGHMTSRICSRRRRKGHRTSRISCRLSRVDCIMSRLKDAR